MKRARADGPLDRRGALHGLHAPQRLCMLCALLLAAACSGVPDEPAAPAAPPVMAAAAQAEPEKPSKPDESLLLAFERRQREAARTAMKQARWADAAWAWDTVLALHPQDNEALTQQSAVQAAVTAALAERLPRAQQAQQRADWDTAARAYLDILLIAPTHGPAADALREIERSRTRRAPAVVAKSAPAEQKSPAARAAATVAQRPLRGTPEQPYAAAPPLLAGADRNLLEHSSLLAAQGELDAAIAMLRPLALAPNAAAQTKRLLAAFYFRLASRLEMADRNGAIKALEQGLVFDPGHAVALARLKLLRPAAPR